MRGGTLFSGIGTPEVAAPWVDWRWSAEIDPFASAVHAARHGVRNLGNVETVNWNEAEPIDLLVFGSPCQSFSVAGKRLGLDDPRGNLALVALRVAARLRPRWLVFENVPGLLSSDAGRDFGAFLGLLGECGYGWAYRVLDARHFGVPQRRRRVFVVGYLGGWRYPASVLFEPESLRRHPAPGGEAGEGIAPDVARCLNASQRRIDGESETFVAYQEAQYGVKEYADAGGLRAGRIPAHSLIAHSLRAEGFDASEDGTGRETPLVPVAFSSKDHGADAGELAPTLRAGMHSRSHANAGVPPAVTVALRGREGGGVAEMGGEQATALRASQGGGDKPHILTSAVRRLTPRECERLQGFPDDFTLVTYRGKPAADGPRYRALGNSMAVPVVRWIMDRLRIADAELNHARAA